MSMISIEMISNVQQVGYDVCEFELEQKEYGKCALDKVFLTERMMSVFLIKLDEALQINELFQTKSII